MRPAASTPLPHDRVAERAVVGACIASAAMTAAIAEGVAQDDFYDLTLGRMFAACKSLGDIELAPRPDLMEVDRFRQSTYVRVGAVAVLTDTSFMELEQLALDTPSTTRVHRCAELVVRSAEERRRLLERLGQLRQLQRGPALGRFVQRTTHNTTERPDTAGLEA
ncbi:DnaB-like helicase N-terminal domain-containing protein [Blastococcus sp. VKM Ac-2987]|uniref:DnaB-like helicase N-terminal domain-containing protein n=1 Tax=Blastococcus sp. VKM Ac-2987 TaxID=3004141 RepID=UPI0022AB64E7|nr:DnaB-like helicase N-terminal domain-containing protein [Blastococcus sp. VKM Ac-2987]MCZ2857418.1 hypothetical protein [Blastococcus sp. VKM Ac-2987]